MKYEDIPKIIRDGMNVDELVFGNGFCLLENGRYKRIDPMKVKLKDNGEYEIVTKEKNYEELLDEFIEIERAKHRAGSGDDMFYEQQVIDYINKQRPFWIDFIKFIETKLH